MERQAHHIRQDRELLANLALLCELEPPAVDVVRRVTAEVAGLPALDRDLAGREFALAAAAGLVAGLLCLAGLAAGAPAAWKQAGATLAVAWGLVDAASAVGRCLLVVAGAMLRVAGAAVSTLESLGPLAGQLQPFVLTAATAMFVLMMATSIVVVGRDLVSGASAPRRSTP